mmetsp:Transcript_1659/g.5149  ORF Transcript_1659/g.5149 Transcript_1659/m.5149 type:complete len:218 (+) Transcript_1659:333-986(+)
MARGHQLWRHLWRGQGHDERVQPAHARLRPRSAIAGRAERRGQAPTRVSAAPAPRAQDQAPGGELLPDHASAASASLPHAARHAAQVHAARASRLQQSGDQPQGGRDRGHVDQHRQAAGGGARAAAARGGRLAQAATHHAAGPRAASGALGHACTALARGRAGQLSLSAVHPALRYAAGGAAACLPLAGREHRSDHARPPSGKHTVAADQGLDARVR